MDLVLGGTGLKMGTDGFRRWGLLASRLMHGDYGNWAERRPGLRGGRTSHLMLFQVLFPKGKQPRRMMIGEGSGFFISADGYI
jgi:hypothetical protein